MLALVAALISISPAATAVPDTVRVPLEVSDGLGPFVPFQGPLRTPEAPIRVALPAGFEADAVQTLDLQPDADGAPILFASRPDGGDALWVVADTDSDGSLDDEEPFRVSSSADASVRVTYRRADVARAPSQPASRCGWQWYSVRKVGRPT